MLKLESISKNFDGLKVLKEVHLEVKEGEILGLIGPNGAGKTTLFNMVSGLLRPDSGQVIFNGSDISGMKAEERVRVCRIGRTFQISRPFANLTCEENIRVGLEMRIMSPTQKAHETENLLKKMGLYSKRFIESRHLPLIEKKKLELARALSIDPRILLLDEIMSGLNPTEADEAAGLVQNLNREFKITIFWIEHLIRAVNKIADRVAVLNQGKLIKVGIPREVLQDKEVIETYLGEDGE